MIATTYEPVQHDVAADAALLRALHRPGTPLLLANAWDPMTARVVAASGLPAVATASAALAPANGFEDHGRMPADVAFAALAKIAAAVACPVTADLEDGYGLAPEVLAERLVVAGACGLNIEDSDYRSGGLSDPRTQAGRIAAIKAAGKALGVDIVVNARIDTHMADRPAEEGLERARRYLDAGADCVYPIFLADPAVIRRYVALGPVNILCRPGGLSLAEIAELGAARVSVGPLLFQASLKHLAGAAAAMRQLDDAGLWA